LDAGYPPNGVTPSGETASRLGFDLCSACGVVDLELFRWQIAER